ncbi:MAG: extracellular solute-binding protein [Candidatus Nanopelagicales bacterium]|jgi:multiple sugar transport system substrate-binding protein
MRLKRSLAGIAALAVLLAACSSGASEDAAEDTSSSTDTTEVAGEIPATDLYIVMAQYTDRMQPYFDDLAARFMEQYPTVTATVEVVNWEQLNDKLATLVATGQAPDIANSNVFANFAADGLLYPAEDIVSPEVLADIVPAFLNNSKYDGTAYAVPDLASARAMFYNKEIFEQAGITEPPTTWAELEAAAAAIKANVPGVFPYGIPLGPEEAQAEFTIWAGGNGGGVYQDGQWIINSAENIEAAEFLASMVDAGYTQPNPATTNRTEVFQLFGEGKIAMVNGSVFFPSVLADQGSTVDFGISGFPHNDGKSAITLGVQDYFFGFKKDGNQAAVKAFMDFIYVPENYLGFLEAAGGFIPATVSAGEQAKSDPAIGPFIDLMPGAIFYPGDLANWPAVQTEMQQKVGLALNDPAGVLGEIQALAEQG